VVIVEAAILIEAGSFRRFDRLILVVCTEEQQIQRAMERGLTREETMLRVSRQMPVAEKKKYANYVIDTSGSKERTIEQTREIYRILRSLNR
ncbi:MAG TPA: dephospho-CoA kinase, partial [Bryobacteraceae bacterium]|nr:dephospho-CoA kinase [Bryobacteraceae bacterium]